MPAMILSAEDDAAKTVAEFANNSDFENIVIVFRKKNFLTRLENFSLEKSANVLLIAKKAIPKLVETAYDKFHFIVTFELNKEEEKPIWRDLSTSKFEIPSQFLSELVARAKVPSQRIRLIANEEPTLYFAGQERARLNLDGYHAQDLARFLDKFAIKRRAEENGIKVAECIELNETLRAMPKGEVFKYVLQQLPLPYFIKPRYGCALVGCIRIGIEAEFSAWLDKTYYEPYPYLIERNEEGTEVCGYMLVRKGQILMMRLFRNIHPVSDFVLKRLPLAKIEICPGSQPYAEIARFSEKLVSVFEPPDGIFGFQAFCSADEIFRLLEVSCRLPGGLFTSLVLKTTGISVESLHIMLSAGLDVDNELIQRVARGPYLAYIRYPRRSGKVAIMHDVMETKSSKEMKWFVTQGQILENPRALAHRHEVLAIEIWNHNYPELEADFVNIVDNYVCIEVE